MRMRWTAWLMALCMLMVASTALADEDAIESMTVRAVLSEDGSAEITEVWEIRNVYDGTEYYKALNGFDEDEVWGLTVSDDRGVVYEYQERWDVDDSFGQKTDRCGVNVTDEGVELCWGISEWGDRTYTITYHLEGLTRDYGDAAGFYHRFISDGMSSAPDFVQVEVAMDGVALSEENCRIWAFGYDGEVHFADGEIVAWSNEALDDYDYVNLLVGMEPTLFDAPVGSGTFAELKERAIDESEITADEIAGVVGALAAVAAVIGGIVFYCTKDIRLADGTKLRRVNEKAAELCGESPVGDSIAMMHALQKLGTTLGTQGSALGAFLIRWSLNGHMTLDQENADDSKGAMRINEWPKGDEVERELFRMFADAADSDGWLTLKEWKKYLTKHQNALSVWSDDLTEQGEELLVERGWAGEASGKVRLTREGYEQYVKLMGYQKYMKQLSEQGDASLEPEAWRQLLVFAAYFGLAKEIEPCFAQIRTDDDRYYGSYYPTYSCYLYATRCGRKYVATAGESGTGGSASSSGGGGFSGGGGGGSR